MTIGAGWVVEVADGTATLKIWLIPKIAANIVPTMVSTVAKIHDLISAFIL